MLQPSFLSKVAQLTYVNPDFELLLLRSRGYDAIFRIITVHGVDLLYCTPGTGHY